MPVLPRLWSLVGNDREALDHITETGPRHALPAAFDVTELASGVVGATQLAAAELLGGGADHPVTVDRRHAAIAFRSERLFTVDGQPPPSAWDPASGYYRTSDGGLIQGWHDGGWGHHFMADSDLSEALSADYSALVVPAGSRSTATLVYPKPTYDRAVLHKQFPGRWGRSLRSGPV